MLPEKAFPWAEFTRIAGENGLTYIVAVKDFYKRCESAGAMWQPKRGWHEKIVPDDDTDHSNVFADDEPRVVVDSDGVEWWIIPQGFIKTLRRVKDPRFKPGISQNGC